MPVRIKTTLQFLPELQKQFKNLEQRTAGGKFATAVYKGADVIRDAVAANAPEKTGRLKRSWTIRRDRSNKNQVAVKITAYSKKGPNPPAPYAHLVEFGSSKQAAHPFIRPAVDGSANHAFQTFTEEFQHEIDEGAR